MFLDGEWSLCSVRKGVGMHIAVVGSGYVGLVAGACFADLGHDVILVDNDQQKLEALKSGQVPIHENFLLELLQRHRGRGLNFTDDLQQAVRASTAMNIAVLARTACCRSSVKFNPRPRWRCSNSSRKFSWMGTWPLFNA